MRFRLCGRCWSFIVCSPGVSPPAAADVPIDDMKLRVLLVSMCCGIGGAAAAFGSRAIAQAHIVESCDALRTLSQARLHCSAERFAEEVDIPAFVARIKSATWGVLFLVGGPSCQPFSQLGSKKEGLEDPRSHPSGSFIRFRDALKADIPLSYGRTFVWLLEEVASVSAACREELSGKLGGRPVNLNAADWGWVHRPRFYLGPKG